MKPILNLLLCILLAWSAEAQVLGAKPSVIAFSIADLKTKVGYSNQYAVLLGSSSVADNGDGKFYWNSSSTATADDVLVVSVSGITTGRWIRIVNDNMYRASWWNLISGGSDQSTKLNNMVTAVPSGAVILMDYAKTYFTSSKWVINKPVTILGNKSSITYSGAASIAVSIQSSDVTIDQLEVNGTYGAHNTGNALIQTEGSSNTSFYSNIIIQRSIIHDGIDAGIRLLYVRNFDVSKNTIYNFPYGGIIVFSGITGSIKGNTVTDITSNGTTGSNAYGIEILRHVSITTDSIPRDVTVEDNTVKRVILWEGIDTHGGVKLTFNNNKVYNCKKGIAIVATGSWTQKDINVTNNLIDNDSLGIAAESGIALEGLISPSLIYATGINVSNNICIGGGGGIKVQYVKGCQITNNVIKKTVGGFGVELDSPNLQITVANNTFLDIMGTGNTACVKSVGTTYGNEAYIFGNVLGDDGATVPASGNKNRYGFRANATNNTLDLIYIGKNNFGAATIAPYANTNYVRFLADEGNGIQTITTATTYVVQPADRIIYYEYASGGTITLPPISQLNDLRSLTIVNKTTATITVGTYYTGSTTGTTIGSNETARLTIDFTGNKIWKH